MDLSDGTAHRVETYAIAICIVLYCVLVLLVDYDTLILRGSNIIFIFPPESRHVAHAQSGVNHNTVINHLCSNSVSCLLHLFLFNSPPRRVFRLFERVHPFHTPKF